MKEEGFYNTKIHEEGTKIHETDDSFSSCNFMNLRVTS